MARKKPPRALIAQAAAMRAGGESWERIAEATGRSSERVRHWPRRYAEEWNRAYHETETHFLADAAVESRQTLRSLLRSNQEWVKLAAAQQMLKGRLIERVLTIKYDHEAEKAAGLTEARQGIQPQDRALAAFISQVKSISDEELEELARKLLNDPPNAPAAAEMAKGVTLVEPTAVITPSESEGESTCPPQLPPHGH